MQSDCKELGARAVDCCVWSAVTVFGAKPEVRLLERLRAAGVTRSLFYLLPGESGAVERQLDQLTEVRAEWAG